MEYKVTSSTIWDEPYGAENILKDDDKRWNSVKGDTKGSWLIIDFKEEKLLNAIKIEEYKENGWSSVKEFEIYVEVNYVWHKVFTGNTIINNNVISFPEQKCNKLKILFTKSDETAIVVAISRVECLYLENYSEIDENGEFSFPLYYADRNNKGNFLYLYGGYHTYGYGCPAWGSIRENDCLYIGDKVGDIVIEYVNCQDRIPLIIGYTVWLKEAWSETKSPFCDESETNLLLEQLLCLDEMLKIRIRDIPIKSITVENGNKVGSVIFTKGCIKEESDYETHIIDSQNPYPDYTLIEKIRRRLYTFEDDFNCVKPFSYPKNYKRARIEFSGDSYANILTHVFHDNIEDMLAKYEDNGMINESTKDSPTWLYNGFGPWLNNRGSYYGSMYSRNHRGIISLSCLDLLEYAQKTVNYDNEMLMYFRNNKLTIKDKEIPGHWCVLINDPLFYSNVLVNCGWPTKYAEKEFGNHEPDGHGLTMIAIANVWENSGSSVKWVEDNWVYLCEAVSYIEWCLDNPDVSFSEHGLLYGESEGGMMSFTMYNNVPCYLGLCMYINMAISARKYETAKKWSDLAYRFEKAILDYFVKDNKWDLSKVGFFHDPSLSTYSDVVGYDVKSDVPDLWYRLSENTYYDDLNAYIGDKFLGVRGLGYDHNLITQSSLLLDKTHDYTLFVKNLAKLCYSPRLPGSFIVPECCSYSKEQGLYRRLGDLGNYAQQSETIRTILMVAGVSKSSNNVVKVIPRLPFNWSIKVSYLTIPGTEAKISYEIKDNRICFCLSKKANINTVMFRLGSFKTDKVYVNGNLVVCERIGDSYWAWSVFSDIEENIDYIINTTEGE